MLQGNEYDAEKASWVDLMQILVSPVIFFFAAGGNGKFSGPTHSGLRFLSETVKANHSIFCILLNQYSRMVINLTRSVWRLYLHAFSRLQLCWSRHSQTSCQRASVKPTRGYSKFIQQKIDFKQTLRTATDWVETQQRKRRSYFHEMLLFLIAAGDTVKVIIREISVYWPARCAFFQIQANYKAYTFCFENHMVSKTRFIAIEELI